MEPNEPPLDPPLTMVSSGCGSGNIPMALYVV